MNVAVLIIATVFAMMLVVPAIQVFCRRRGPVDRTPLMARRIREAHQAGRTDFVLTWEWVDLPHISEELIKAVIVVEDRHFAVHRGFDVARQWKTVRKALQRGIKIAGCSTITNQVARNVFLTIRRSYLRKAAEFYYTFWIELLWGKRRIMEVYLNMIEMGDGLFGCAAAARHYFGKTPMDLDCGESAMIAVSLRNPRKWNPDVFRAGFGKWSVRIVACKLTCDAWKVGPGGIWDLARPSRFRR